MIWHDDKLCRLLVCTAHHLVEKVTFLDFLFDSCIHVNAMVMEARHASQLYRFEAHGLLYNFWVLMYIHPSSENKEFGEVLLKVPLKTM